MKTSLAVSALLGIIWAVLVVYLLTGFRSGYIPVVWLWIMPGVGAGLMAGYSVIWSTRRGWGFFKRGFLSYYSGIIGYWILLFIALRFQNGLWGTFNLRDNLNLLPMLLLYGTIPYGVILIPLGFLSAFSIHRIYTRKMPNKAVDSTATRVTPPAEQEPRHGQP
jgi:hypothetical protein